MDNGNKNGVQEKISMSDDNKAMFSDVDACVDEAINTVGDKIVLGLPIAVGKPTHIANAFYRRARENKKLQLIIYSGLTLRTPGWNSELERRFVEPLAQRLFPGYPNPEYQNDALAGRLPDNVELREIYLSPGSGLNVAALQQGYTASNYTHVSRDVAAGGCNVVALMVSPPQNGLYSTGSNADAAVMMARDITALRRTGHRVCMLGQVNSAMPYMYGAGEIEAADFTGMVADPQYGHALFAPPKEPVTTAEHCIGLHVASLIRDGGTFQVGFGSLADAVVYAMQLRHDNNDAFYRALTGAGIIEKFFHIIEETGGTGTFKKGLYGCSEFIFDGFVHLMNSGIIRRRVYDHPDIQRLVMKKGITENVGPETLDALLEDRVISNRITEEQFHLLRGFGILRGDVEYDGGRLIANGKRISADLGNAKSRALIESECLGDTLKNGHYIHAGFFIGSQWFYDALRNMDPDARRLIRMREIKFVNSLSGHEELKHLQRRHGRFVNTAMMATVLGGIASDTLENNQVVSGVGGQYNFVSMAHDLSGARSIITVRAVRDKDGEPAGNIVWTAANLTVPRHLRDMFVTEYGIADVRGRTDRDTVAAMLNIADSRFQNQLLRKAKTSHKLPRDYRIPDAFRNNTPDTLEQALAPYRKKGLFPVFPYGTELTKEEITLARALRGLKIKMSLKGFRLPAFDETRKIVFPPEAARPYLERLGLDKPANIEERGLKKLVLYALAAEDAI